LSNVPGQSGLEFGGDDLELLAAFINLNHSVTQISNVVFHATTVRRSEKILLQSRLVRPYRKLCSETADEM